MKRLIVILLINLSVVSIFAQLTMPQLYKQWMIEDINNGKYEKAVENFKKIDLLFEYNEIDYGLNLSKYDEFAPIALNSDISKLQAVSIYLYIADALNDIANHYEQENNVDDALNVREIALNYYTTTVQMMEDIKLYDTEYYIWKQLLLHNYISSLLQMSLNYVDFNDYETAEKTLLSAIAIEKQRQSIPNINKYDLGVDLEDVLVQIRTWSLSFQQFANVSIIDYADKILKEQKKDTTAIALLIEASGYAGNISDFERKDYYLRTAFKWVEEDLNLQKQMSDQLYYDLLIEVTGHYYENVSSSPIISETEMNDASRYIEKVYGKNSVQSLSYSITKVMYYEYMDEIDKAISINESLIDKMDTQLKKKKNINDEIKELYVLAHLILSGSYEVKYNMFHRDTTDNEYMTYKYSLQRPESEYALQTLKKIIDNPQFNDHLNIEFYNSYIELCYRLNKTIEIWKVVPQYFKQNQEVVDNALTSMSEDEALFWYANFPFMYDNTILFATKDSTMPNNIIGDLYNNELFKKGILLRTNKRLQEYILNSNDTTVVYLFNRLVQQKSQLFEWQMTKKFEDEDTQELIKSINSTERLLSSISNDFAKNKKESEISWKEIQANLKSDEVAIEFLNAGYIDQYWALVIRKEFEYPKLIYLSDFQNLPKEEIQQRWEFYQQNLDFCIDNNFPKELYPELPHYLEFTGDANEVYKYGKNGTELYNALWQPLLEYINEGEIIYFSPTGVLHQLAIEALPISQTEVLADRYDLHRVSSTRELAMRSLDSSISNATLYGGIIYDISAESMEAESQKYDLSQLSLPTSHRGNDTDRGSVKYLPGTKQEVENISLIFKTKKIKHNLLKGEQANEESFKLMSGKQNDIIHIATHGFFWSDNDAKQKEYLQQRGIDDIQQIYINPLERCGLCLAGANLALRGHSNQLTTQGIQDGILTAQEISILDLSNTQLVVLSACETGLGEITSDGVFGLQRAFKQAGVQTIVMSLWKVDDETTQNFMTKFYQYWLTGETKHQAFHHAQNDIRKVKPNPYYWAAFIMLD